jgi:ornithine carbamoyltransferase
MSNSRAIAKVRAASQPRPSERENPGGTPRHFLDLRSLGPAAVRAILDLGVAMKRAHGRERRSGTGRARPRPAPLKGRILALIFDKPSTRTRVSFEVAMRQLGGTSLMLRGNELQLERGESLADTARVLSRYVDAIVIRTSAEPRLREFAAHAQVPVINGLTDRSHPCQIMADVLTFEEKKGPIRGRIIAWSGDGNNVANSWIEAAVKLGFELRLACPGPLRPDAETLRWAQGEGGKILLCERPEQAVEGADAVVTDCWVSMGMPTGDRPRLLAPYRVSERLMRLAKPDAIFMHCLPAHRGEEVDAAVIDGPQSVVFDEAENRLHAQKGILTWCLRV